jgi:YesN/AraC family two-component response regulator
VGVQVSALLHEHSLIRVIPAQAGIQRVPRSATTTPRFWPDSPGRFGACDYLLKPIEENALNSAIEKALHRIDPDLVFGQNAAKTTNISPEEVISIIKEFVESNYCTNIKISMFADKYFFSQEYLNKLFKNKYGYTIYEYVLKLRMERAKELLGQPDIKIMDIAERLGYADNHYFSKAFRTYYHVTPTQYRNQLQNP